MGDAILAARIRLLRRSLVNIQEALEGVERERNRRTPQAAALSTSDALAEIHRLVAEITGTLFDSYRTAYGAVLGRLNDIERHRTDIELKLGPTGEGAAADPSVVSLKDLREGPHDYLAESARQRLDELDSIERKMGNAADREAAGEADEAATLMAECWTEITDVREDSRALFAEYVDFLGGLAIREIGLDNGMGRIADRMVKEWKTNRWPWSSMTVPAWQEVGELTLAQMIRLGFPEWSVWALPLAAHQFAGVAWAAKLERELSASGGTTEPLTVLADIFATYLMGPAYGSAALLLRLDPLAVKSDPASVDARRAAAIDGTLEALDDLDATKPFTAVRRSLRGYWEAALAQAGAKDPMGPSDRESIQRAVRALTIAIGSGRALPATKWAMIEDWSQKLAEGTDDTIDLANADNREIRFVLNAAWLARLSAMAMPDADLDAIAQRAILLADRMLSSEGAPPSPPGTGTSRAGAARGQEPKV